MHVSTMCVHKPYGQHLIAEVSSTAEFNFSIFMQKSRVARTCPQLTTKPI